MSHKTLKHLTIPTNSRHRVDKLLALMPFTGLKDQPDSALVKPTKEFPVAENDPEMKQTGHDAEMSNLTESCSCHFLCENLFHK